MAPTWAFAGHPFLVNSRCGFTGGEDQEKCSVITGDLCTETGLNPLDSIMGV